MQKVFTHATQIISCAPSQLILGEGGVRIHGDNVPRSSPLEHVFDLFSRHGFKPGDQVKHGGRFSGPKIVNLSSVKKIRPRKK